MRVLLRQNDNCEIGFVSVDCNAGSSKDDGPCHECASEKSALFLKRKCLENPNVLEHFFDAAVEKKSKGLTQYTVPIYSDVVLFKLPMPCA